MIEVNVTVSELTDNVNVEADSYIHYEGVKNPLVHVTVINRYTQTFPPMTRVVDGLFYEDGMVIRGGVAVLAMQSKEAAFLSICNHINIQEYVFYLEDTEDMEVSCDENIEYDQTEEVYKIIDSSQDAYMTVVFGEF